MAIDESITKCCTKCKTEKPVEMFSRHIRGKNGRAESCKSCKRKQDSLYREANRDSIKERKREFYAKNKDKIIESQRQYKYSNLDKTLESARRRARKWREANLDEARKRSRECQQKARENDPNKARESYRRYGQMNPEKIRVKCANRRAIKRAVGGKLSRDLALKLFKLQRGKCACCGKPLGTDYHLDHIIPLALGGSNTDNNIQLLLAKCNQQKQAKHPVDFMRQRGFLL